MSEFTSVPQHGTFELTMVDGNPSSRANLQFVLFYETVGNLRAAQSERLRKAFYQALSHYPILFGRLEHKTDELLGIDRVQVTLSEDTKADGTPSYTEFDVQETISSIKQANYIWSSWPQQLLSICPIRGATATTSKDKPLVQCIITWHSDGMGILISVDHSIADGIGIDILLNQWATVARASSNGSAPNAAEILLPIDFDHKSVYDELCKAEPQSDWFVDFVDSVDMSKASAETGAIDNNDPRTPTEIEQALRANLRALRITPESLKRLYSDMCPGATKEKHVPVIRLVYALMWKCYSGAWLQSSESNEHCFLNVIHSARHLLNRPHYIGNAVCPVYMRQSVRQIQQASVYQLAHTIGSCMHAVTPSRWLATLQLLQDSQRYAKFLTIFANPTANQLTISNISRLNFFNVDFGFGRPVHATVYPMMIPGFATWLPLCSAGGLHILWNMPDSIAAKLQCDGLFKQYVEML
ncbi:hypothetical protein IWW36_000756 [Coemansia brasiliensis]|uniref:Uncharacterized protein n=1 Tax=Coemansia brasiliensis TaxID=2650707 RepID=A0A9W8M2K5_9FUNG|nr:hypothetical protein IWW36_000756 [Coemansia brasiliensis]